MKDGDSAAKFTSIIIWIACFAIQRSKVDGLFYKNGKKSRDFAYNSLLPDPQASMPTQNSLSSRDSNTFPALATAFVMSTACSSPQNLYEPMSCVWVSGPMLMLPFIEPVFIATLKSLGGRSVLKHRCEGEHSHVFSLPIISNDSPLRARLADT